MAADNSTVKITIDVVDANSGAVVGQVTRNLNTMGTAGTTAGEKVAAGATKGMSATQRLAAQLKAAAEAGDEAGRKIAAGMGNAGAHTLTNLDKVRLLRDDLGIRIPRAMEMVIARSSALSSAIGAIGSGLVALGTIEIFARLASGVYAFYQRMTDVNAAMRKFAEESAKSSKDELFNNASIETTRTLVAQIRADKEAIDAQRTAAGVGLDNSGSFTQYLKYAFQGVGANPGGISGKAPGMAPIKDPKLYTGADGQRDAGISADQELLSKRQALQDRQAALQKAQNKADLAGAGLVGTAAEGAKTKAKNALADAQMYATQAEEQYNKAATQRARLLEDQQGTIPQEQRTKVFEISPDAGKSVRDQTVQQNNAEMGANLSGNARKQAEETLHIQAEARSAGLQGEAKYMAERDEQLRQLREKLRDTELSPIDAMRRVAAVEQQFAAERQKRLDTEHAETARMQAEAAAGGTRGMASIDARLTTEIAGIDKSAPGFADAGTKDAREAAARKKAQDEIAEATRNFNERLTGMDMGHADATMSTNQKIELSATRTIAEIEKAWKDEYSELAALDQRRVQSRQAVDALIAKTNRDATEQERQARQALVDETEKMELEGNRRGLTREQEARQAILDEYAERYKHLEELRAKDRDNADLYRRQEIAAEEIKNGKLIEEQRAMRDKLAGELRGFMSDHPLKALEELGAKQASQYAADFLMKATNRASGTANVGAGGHKGALAGLLGFGAKPKQSAEGHPAALTSTTSTVSAASTTLTTGSATINITGTATFTGLSNGGGGAALPAVAALHAATGKAPSVATANGRSYATQGTTQVGDAGSTISSTTDSSSGNYGTLTSTNSTTAGGSVGTLPSTGPGGLGSGSTSDDAPPKLLADSQNVLGMGQSAADLGKQMFGKDGLDIKGAANVAGNASSALGQVGGAVGAGASMFSAIVGSGGLGGALQGGIAGAELGNMVGGPVGAAIGAAAGATIGFIGFGGASKANKYYRDEVKPRIANDITGFGMGSMPYQSTYDDLIALDKEARQKTKAFGMGGKRVWNEHIHPDIINAQHELTREQKAGRSQYGIGAAQYHNGGLINGFGDMSTTGNQGWIHAQQGEFVMQQQQVPSHYQALSMMQSGASHSDMASYYGGSAAPTAAPGSSSNDVNLHFHSHDARGTYQLFMDHKHSIREALNQSYAENSGGTD